MSSRATQGFRRAGRPRVSAVPGAVAVLGWLMAHSASAAQIDVGTGSGCEAASLQSALGIAAFNGVGTADEIRLTRTVTYANMAVELSDWDVANEGALTISGGWDSCTDATASGRTVLSGDATAAATMRIKSPNQSSQVTLRGLELAAGTLGLLVEDASTVLLQSSEIRLNEGGMAALNGADVEIDSASQIIENVGASQGGGIRCAGAGTTVILAGRVADNEVVNHGGGIYGADGCVVKLRAGVWIEGNTANLGGGLYLAGSARAENLGTGTAGVNIYENTAHLEGGGIYMTGAGPQTLLGNVRIVSNLAGQRGGGIALVAGAKLQLERFNFETCLTPPRCTKVNENTALTFGWGSAVYADGGAEFRMFQAYLEANQGPDFAGFAIFATGAGTSMLFEGVQISHNYTRAVFQATNGAEIDAAFISAARNLYQDEGGPTTLDSRGAQATGGAAVRLYSSIMVDQRPFVASDGGSITADCLLLDDPTGLTGQFASMVGVNPQFRDADAGDLHLSLDSPAIDSCDSGAYVPLDSDFDLDARGYDLASVPNVLGPFDRGVDEVRPLFADGFESGGTGAWSSTVP